MKKLLPYYFLCICLATSFLAAGAFQGVAAQNPNLPPANFPVLTRTSQGDGSQLPSVHGVHLIEGQDRRPGEGTKPYSPGEESLNGALVRWDTKLFPLKVWISTGLKLPEAPFDALTDTRVQAVVSLLAHPESLEALPKAPGWTPEMSDAVGAGIEQWKEMQDEGVVRFGFVDDPTQANVLVFFTDQFIGASGPGGSDVHGHTVGTIYPAQKIWNAEAHGEPRPASTRTPVIIELKVNDDYSKLQAEAAHEFGHALGIKAHSPYREDLMHINRIVDTLSPADKATLRNLYRSKPQYLY